MPSGDSDELVPVPTIHVLRVVDQPTTIVAVDPEARSGLISYLANLFEPQDPVAAELLMLTLLSAPISRQPGQEVLGTLSLNIITPESTETSKAFIKAIGSVSPYVVTLPLSIASLHDHAFLPTSADSTSLASGILQLCNGTVLAIQEGEMGSGGQLEERAVKNLQALVDCLRTQTLQYVYPYMDNLRMDCAIRGIVFSEGKSLIPVRRSALLRSLTSGRLDRACNRASEICPVSIGKPIEVPILSGRPGSTRFRRYGSGRSGSIHTGRLRQRPPKQRESRSRSRNGSSEKTNANRKASQPSRI